MIFYILNFYPLIEGSFSVDSTKRFIPFREGIDDPKSRPGSLFIHVQPFLVETDSDLILLDTGLGQLDPDQRPQIYHQIESHGFKPEEITMVILSHLHSDHSLGLVQGKGEEMRLNFPGAVHFVQKGEMEEGLNPDNGSYPHALIQFFQKNAELVIIDQKAKIAPGIEVELSGGHCAYHQVVLLQDRYETLFFGGDVLPEGIQLVRNYIAKYDFDGRKSMELRKYYGELAAKEGWTCLYYHDNNPSPYSTIQLGPEGGFSLNYPAL